MNWLNLAQQCVKRQRLLLQGLNFEILLPEYQSAGWLCFCFLLLILDTFYFQTLKCVDSSEAERKKGNRAFKCKYKCKSSVLWDSQWRWWSRHPDKWREESRCHGSAEEAATEDQQEPSTSFKQNTRNRWLQNRTGKFWSPYNTIFLTTFFIHIR